MNRVLPPLAKRSGPSRRHSDRLIDPEAHPQGLREQLPASPLPSSSTLSAAVAPLTVTVTVTAVTAAERKPSTTAVAEALRDYGTTSAIADWIRGSKPNTNGKQTCWWLDSACTVQTEHWPVSYNNADNCLCLQLAADETDSVSRRHRRTPQKLM